MPFAATCMALEIIILSEECQRKISYGIMYMLNLKKIIQMNLLTKQTHRLQKQAYGYERGKVKVDKQGDWE